MGQLDATGYWNVEGSPGPSVPCPSCAALRTELQEARRLLESAVKLNEFENRWPVFCQTVRAFLEKNNKRRGGGFDAG